MNIEEYREYCMSFTGTSEGFAFDHKTLVFKVMGKMFALTDVDSFISINLKGNPDKNIDLRELYSGINPGFHMNKSHWNTINTDGSVPEELLFEMIKESYDLVVSGLTKVLKEELRLLAK